MYTSDGFSLVAWSLDLWQGGWQFICFNGREGGFSLVPAGLLDVRDF